MNITPDLIRRFPYAVNPERISESMEAVIAIDMAVAARKEGHHKALPPSGFGQPAAAAIRRADEEAEVFRCLSMGDRTVWHVAARSGLQLHTVQNALTRMKAKGVVIATERKRNDLPQAYAINPAYQPAEATRTLQAEGK